jgi:hypothetical protein
MAIVGADDPTAQAVSPAKLPGLTALRVPHDQWQSGDLMVDIVDRQDQEIGPGLLRYGGTAFFIGVNGHTGVYSANATPQWSNGPDLPAQKTLATPSSSSSPTAYRLSHSRVTIGITTYDRRAH